MGGRVTQHMSGWHFTVYAKCASGSHYAKCASGSHYAKCLSVRVSEAGAHVVVVQTGYLLARQILFAVVCCTCRALIKEGVVTQRQRH